MTSRRPVTSSNTLFSGLTILAFLSTSESFVPSTKTKQCHPFCAPFTRSNAVVNPPPAEYRREEKQEETTEITIDNDWTPTRGGYIPNISERRELLVEDDSLIARSTITKPETKRKVLVQEVELFEQFKSIVVEEREKIVAVRFYASWCKSCRATTPLFRRLAAKYGASVKFVQIPLTKETVAIHEALDVPSVPHGHIYHPEAGLVEEKRMTRRVFDEFEESLESYVVGSCDLPEEFQDSEDELCWL